MFYLIWNLSFFARFDEIWHDLHKLRFFLTYNLIVKHFEKFTWIFVQIIWNAIQNIQKRPLKIIRKALESFNETITWENTGNLGITDDMSFQEWNLLRIFNKKEIKCCRFHNNNHFILILSKDQYNSEKDDI